MSAHRPTSSSSEDGQRRADEFFGPLAGHLDAVVTAYPPELLARFEDFVGDLRGAMEDFLTGHEGEGAAWPPERAG